MSTPLWTNYLTQFVVAVVATISFGITFHVPKRHYLAGGLTGAVGWMAYILCYDLLGVSAPVAVLIATLPLTLCARADSAGAAADGGHRGHAHLLGPGAAPLAGAVPPPASGRPGALPRAGTRVRGGGFRLG